MQKTCVILHHSATAYTKGLFGYSKQFDGINNYHKAQWNFKSSLGLYGGYHYLIEASGEVRQYRKDNEVGAHCYQQDMNRKSIGICLAGHFDIQKPTPMQIYALRDLLKKVFKNNNIDKIYPHNKFAAYKSCPGKNIDLGFITSLVK